MCLKRFYTIMPKAVQIALTEAVLEYAAPELELPDFELAKSLKKIDDELITKINYNQYFPSDKSLLKGKLPSWAINYLNEISNGPSVPEDPQRETSFMIFAESILYPWKLDCYLHQY